MFFIGTSNFELKLDFIIYSFLLRLQRDYRDYDALIMFNFYLFKELNGSVFFCEVLFLKLLKFKYWLSSTTNLSCSPVYHAINISFTVTYATRKKKNSKIQDVQNWFSLSGNILCMFLKLNTFYLHIKRVLIYKKECITQFLWEYSRDWHDTDWKKHCFHKKGDQTCK